MEQTFSVAAQDTAQLSKRIVEELISLLGNRATDRAKTR